MTRSAKAVIPVLVAFLLSSCTRQAPAYKAGEMPLQFDPAAVSSLEIAKADPKTGDRWATKVTRNRQGHWEIQSGPGGGALLDRQAHSSFVDHLLDTFKTLQIVGPAPKGPPESFGLAPPRFAFRWQEREIRFGNDSFVQLGPEANAVYEVKGAALKMLENIETFESLRQQTLLAPLTPDDVDEIEVFLRGRSAFYAQREGDVWTDRKHRPYKGDVGGTLERLVHQRILRFIDDETVSVRNISEIRRAPLWSLGLKDRQGKEVRVELGARAFCTVTSRPGAVFEIFPDLIALVESLATGKLR